MSLLEELKRRNVLRVATAYIVAAWLIIQVLDTVFPRFGLSDAAFRIAVIVLVIGFVPAVIGAWVFQITPAGLVLDKDSDQSRAPAPQTARRLDRAIIVVLALGVTYFAIDKFAVNVPDESGFYGSRSIAVLPFDTSSLAADRGLLVGGIADEISNALATIRELRVISRTSVNTAAQSGSDLQEIASRLDVAHVLEGSIRMSGDTARIAVQLIEAGTDTQLWSATYDRGLNDVFAIQDEIAVEVAESLKIELLRPLGQSRTVNPEAYALTAEAHRLAEVRPDGLGEKMYDLLTRALEIDPDYVPALEWMFTANYFRVHEGLITQAEKIVLSEDLLSRILAIDPDNGYVDAVRAFEADSIGATQAAARFYESSLAKDATDSNAARLAGVFARGLGKLETAEMLLRHAVAIDPLCFQCLYRLSNVQFYLRDYAAAEKTRERYLAIGSGGHYHHGLMKLLQGDGQSALAIYEAMPNAGSGQQAAGLAMTYHALGETEKARAELERLSASPDPDRVSLLAQTNAFMGNKDEAFKWLQLMAAETPGFAIQDVFHPVHQSLHDDPRWTEWRASIGMSQADLDAITFNPVLPE